MPTPVNFVAQQIQPWQTGATVTLGGVTYSLDVLIAAYNAGQHASELLGSDPVNGKYTAHGAVHKLLQMSGLEPVQLTNEQLQAQGLLSKASVLESLGFGMSQEVQSKYDVLKALGFDVDALTDQEIQELWCEITGGSDATE